MNGVNGASFSNESDCDVSGQFDVHFDDPEVCFQCDLSYCDSIPTQQSGDTQSSHSSQSSSSCSCSFCDKLCSEPDKLLSHVKTVHESRYGKCCKNCGQKFRNWAMCWPNRLLGVVTKPFRCSICNRQFTSRKAALLHIRKSHESPKPHKCQQCLKPFSDPESMQQHVRASHAPSFQCTHCARAFYTGTELEEHSASHNLVQCKECGRMITSENFLSHMSAYHKRRSQRTVKKRVRHSPYVTGDGAATLKPPVAAAAGPPPLERAPTPSREPFIDSDGSVTKCVCGFNSDVEGHMIQCEECFVWQHSACVGVLKDIPVKYFCEICRTQDG
eukprot:989939_1